MVDLRVTVGDAIDLTLDALREIRGHKIRSVLTLFGIVFGTASVVAMTSFASSLKFMAYDELQRMGMPATVGFDNRGPPSDATRAADLREVGLRVADVGALDREAWVHGAFGLTWMGQMLVSGPRDQRVIPVSGVDAGYLRFRNYPIVQGRDLAPLDIVNAARVAILGEELVAPFFGTENPIGQTLAIAGLHFLIVGVVAPVELELVPEDFSFLARRIYVPYTYVTRYYRSGPSIDEVIVRVGDDEDFAERMAEATALLRARHRGADDFEVENEAADVAENLAMADGILGGWNAVLLAIAGVTLVVGGVGLFSVLLISVRERVREIGIRMALGANDRDIRWLFLVESMMLALIGAAVGIAGGVGLIVATETIASTFGRSFSIPIHLPGTISAVIFAVLVGLLFGWYPASRAAKLNPIEAIREL